VSTTKPTKTAKTQLAPIFVWVDGNLDSVAKVIAEGQQQGHLPSQLAMSTLQYQRKWLTITEAE
jgi:hypothetical protein